MELLTSLLSQLLGGSSGGAAGAGAAGAGGGGFTNPFSGIMGGIGQLVGGPASQQGTLFSLPGELAEGAVDLAGSENIIGDILGLSKPILGLASEGLGLASKGLGIVNPFKYLGFGAEGGAGLASLPPPLSGLALAAPFLGLGAGAAYTEERDEKRRLEALRKQRR